MVGLLEWFAAAVTPTVPATFNATLFPLSPISKCCRLGQEFWCHQQHSQQLHRHQCDQSPSHDCLQGFGDQPMSFYRSPLDHGE